MPSAPIKYVVDLMLENHSFDQMLGAFRSVFPEFEGIDPANRFLTEKWTLDPLTEPVARAQSFSLAIRTTGQPRTDTPLALPLPTMAAAPPMTGAGPGEPLNGHQKALIAFSEYLEREIEEPVVKPARAAMMAGPPSQVENCADRAKFEAVATEIIRLYQIELTAYPVSSVKAHVM